MIWLKILLPLFIILFAYSVTSEDLNEVKRFGWLRARQLYQNNHPPLVESDVSPVVYDKVIDKSSRRHKLIKLSISENSTDGSQFDKNVSIPENKISTETLKTTTALLDVESTSEHSETETTTDSSEDATEFPEGLITTSTYKRRFNLPKYTDSYETKPAPVTVSYNDELIHIVANEVKSNLSSNRKHIRPRPSVDGSKTADTKTESKDDNTESSILHLISSDIESKIYETESVSKAEPSKPGLQRQRKYKNPQYNRHRPQDSNEGNTKSKINDDLNDAQIVREGSLTNKDSESSVQNANNEGSEFTSKNQLGSRRYFKRPQKVPIGRQYDAEIDLSSSDNKTENTQTNTKNILKTLENTTTHNEEGKYIINDSVTPTIANYVTETVTTSNFTNDEKLKFSTRTSQGTRKFLHKSQRNSTNFYRKAQGSRASTKNEDMHIQTNKTDASENKETIQLLHTQSSSMENNSVRENVFKNRSESIVTNEVTARKYLRKPQNISSTNPFNDTTISQNAKVKITQMPTGEIEEASAASANTDSLEAVEVDNDYKSKSRFALDVANLQSNKNSTEHSLVKSENADEQTKLITSSVTNGEFTTNTKSTQNIKDNIEFTNTQVTDSIIPTTTRIIVKDDNSKLAEKNTEISRDSQTNTLSLKLKSQITTMRRYSSSTASSISSNTANVEEINATATSNEKTKSKSNHSRLRSGSRGHITYQSSKVDRNTNNVKSVSQNINAERKHKIPSNKKTYIASSIVTETISNSKFQKTADQPSKTTDTDDRGSEIRKDTALENVEAKPITDAQTNVAHHLEYKNVSSETKQTNYFKRGAASTRPPQDNEQILTITTEAANSHVQNTENYTANTSSTPEQSIHKKTSSENTMQVNENIKTLKSRNIGQNKISRKFRAESSKLNENYEDVPRTTNRSRIDKTSNPKPMKTITQQLIKEGASSSENQHPVLLKDVNEDVEKPFNLKQRQSIKTTKTTISHDSKQEGLESEGKYSTTVAINTTEKTKTLVSTTTEPNVIISGNPTEAPIFTQSRTKSDTYNSEINDYEAASGSLSPSRDVILEKPVQHSVEVDTQRNLKDDSTPKNEKSSAKNSERSYSQTSRPHGARDPVVSIIKSENRVFSQNGKFVYSYEGADGTRAFSNGHLKEVSKDHAGEAVQGGFSYTDQDGNDFSLSYTADENGYRPVGAHLPTPPPIPPAIARALAFLATKTTPEPITESPIKN